MINLWDRNPILVFEVWAAARRWQTFLVRAGFITCLAVALAVVWLKMSSRNLPPVQLMASVGEYFYLALTGTQLALILLAAPAATAGAICRDKAQGLLTHVLVTDLRAWEVVLGKLAARLVPVLALLLGALPVLFLASLLGGIDDTALFGAFLVALGVLLFGCAVAFTLSLFAHRTHEALLGTYLLITGLLLTPPIWDHLNRGAPPWVWRLSPFWLTFAPYNLPSAKGWRLADAWWFLLGCGTCAAVLVALAGWRFRAVVLNPVVRVRRRGPALQWPGFVRRWAARLPGPGLDANPVLWREWRRPFPSVWSRVLWYAFVGLAAGFGLLAAIEGADPGARPKMLLIFNNGLTAALGLLFLTVLAVTGLAEERARGMDELLSTPLASRAILRGKWWGAFRRVLPVALLPTLVTAVTCAGLLWAHATGRASRPVVWAPPDPALLLYPAPLTLLAITAYGWGFTSLGLYLAVRVQRMGRAIALAVGVYVLIAAGWFFLMVATTNGDTGPAWATLSPFWGSLYPLMLVERHGTDAVRVFVAVFGWSAFYFAAGGVLWWRTVANFDRCLGRVPEDGAEPDPRRHPRPLALRPGGRRPVEVTPPPG
jgi:hypothetical protein